MYPKHAGALFRSRSGAPFISSWLIGLSSVTERAPADNVSGHFCCKLLQNKKLARLSPE